MLFEIEDHTNIEVHSETEQSGKLVVSKNTDKTDIIHPKIFVTVTGIVLREGHTFQHVFLTLTRVNGHSLWTVQLGGWDGQYHHLDDSSQIPTEILDAIDLYKETFNVA